MVTTTTVSSVNITTATERAMNTMSSLSSAGGEEGLGLHSACTHMYVHVHTHAHTHAHTQPRMLYYGVGVHAVQALLYRH